MLKNNNKNNSSVCRICNRIIFKNIDNYVHLMDYKEGKFFMEGFYHTKCYNDRVTGDKDTKEMKKKAMALLNKASEMMGFDKKEEPKKVVYIR